MPAVSQQPLPRFASLPAAAAPAPGRGWGISQLFSAPFRDVDDRVARLAAANRREREAREAARSGAAELQR